MPADFVSSNYQEDGRIVCLQWDTILAINGDRTWIAMFEHATLSAPELVVTFRPRRVYVVM